MVVDYKKIDLFGKSFIQKIVLKPPFDFAFPEADRACFLYMLQGDTHYQTDDHQIHIPTHHSLLLNCIQTGKKILESKPQDAGEIVIITFHPDILQKIYERELPFILQPSKQVSKQLSGKINNDFLIRKYIEGLLFYFENPSLVNDEILVLKLKEIILLLSQTQDADTVQVILSQLFSASTYTFKQIIQANLFLPLSIEVLAQKTNLSVSSFKREFKKLYHDSPANHIKSKRLERATQLLLASDERITDVGYGCGFNDLANFTKSFHDKYGLTPSNYRLKFKNKNPQS